MHRSAEIKVAIQFVDHIHVLKVSETAFSLTAGYFLAYWWYDKRVTLKKGDKIRYS